ncbi:DUF2171 domain-containing protein [Deinococcus yavapaiensis]|uniref:DUF2171 domain-containing protein n=1 Tax=Deinococcus yavapaiensis KR-236 TaxID=694435 RepID=A0A318SM13_9DEIO|nr:DUF2171 domain-containing protein [Deinococcus yavapaiensis]PYE55723.1 hypothetical protein DES52_10286 [Deinococcus yavapaiensis KR-236]
MSQKGSDQQGNDQDRRRAAERRFDSDFRRSIQNHMSIRGNDGQEVGTVDRIDGAFLKVTKDEDGNHHWIEDIFVARVDQHVHLTVPAAEMRANWLGGDPNAGGGHEAHEAHERSEVKGERLHKTHEQRNEQQ